jgi:hypothetical protein
MHAKHASTESLNCFVSTDVTRPFSMPTLASQPFRNSLIGSPTGTTLAPRSSRLEQIYRWSCRHAAWPTKKRPHDTTSSTLMPITRPSMAIAGECISNTAQIPSQHRVMDLSKVRWSMCAVYTAGCGKPIRELRLARSWKSVILGSSWSTVSQRSKHVPKVRRPAWAEVDRSPDRVHLEVGGHRSRVGSRFQEQINFIKVDVTIFDA